jgi:hypothetical protein
MFDRRAAANRPLAKTPMAGKRHAQRGRKAMGNRKSTPGQTHEKESLYVVRIRELKN